MESILCGHTLQLPGPMSSASLASLPETRRLVATAALDKFFSDSFLNISQLRDVMSALEIPQDSEAFNLLRTLHCVSYKKMSPELRERIPQLVNEALTHRETYTHCLATEVAVARVNF